MEILGLFKIFMKLCPRGTVPTWARFPAPGNTGPNIFHESRGPRIYSRKHGTESIKSRYREYGTESIKSRYREYRTEWIKSRYREYGTESVESRYRDVAGPRVNQFPVPRIRDQLFHPTSQHLWYPRDGTGNSSLMLDLYSFTKAWTCD